MKPKVTRGGGFKGALDYVFDEGAKATGHKQPELVGGTMCGTDPRSLSAEFGHTRRIRKDIKKPVWHCSLALPADDRLTGQQWEDIAANFLKKMGFPPDTQWVAVRHQDTDYDHIHIIASRVSLSGQVWYGQHEAFKAIAVAQELEHKYGLTITQGLYGEAKPIASLTQGEVEMSLASGQESPKQVLQRLVAAAAAGKPTVVEFTDRLAAVGVSVLPNLASTGRLSGFSFEYQGIAFKGSKLGKAYGWPSLQKMGVTYVEDRDRAQLERLKTKVERDTASDGLASTTRDAVEASATATEAARRAADAATRSASDAERNQQLRATTERSVAAARATTDVTQRVVEAAKTGAGASGNTAAAAGCTGAAALAATAELRAPERTLRALARYCRAAVHRLRAVVEQRIGRGEAGVPSGAGASTANRSSVQAGSGWSDRIAGFREWADRAAARLSAVVVVPEPQPEQQFSESTTMTQDALDSALEAAIRKVQQQQEVELDISNRPVIGSDDFDHDNDPLAQSASPQPTDDELADLVPEGVAEALELLYEQQDLDEDEIDFDDLDDGPSGPNFG